MKTFRLFAIFAFAIVFAASAAASSAFAQGGAVPVAAQAGMAKIVVIDTGAFADEKGGIAKYVQAVKSIDTTFTPVQTDLQTSANKIEALRKELEVIQNNINSGKVPVDKAAAQAKADQYQNLQTEFKRKQEDAKARFDREQERVMGPVMQDIFKAMQDFATQKGYDMILDAVKLDAQQMILAYVPNKVDVTKEFIVYYNSRPPGSTASAATPK